MLEIFSEFKGQHVSDATSGNANTFVQRVIIEVLTDNYRQMLAEAVTSPSDVGRRLDPPLRTNERGISGLFASAVGHVSARYRTEARINRSALQEDNITFSSHAGRVDYLAWYERRVIGLELKIGSMNAETGSLNEPLTKRWNEVVNQAQAAQKYLRDRSKENKIQFPDPLSIALLVVIGRRKMVESRAKQVDLNIKAIKEESIKNLSKIGDRRKPKFISVYTFPDQFRIFYPKRKGHADYNAGDNIVYAPFVAFLARAYVQGMSSVN